MNREPCTLCGQLYEPGKLFVAAQASACNECITNLIDYEMERRANLERTIEAMRFLSGKPLVLGTPDGV